MTTTRTLTVVLLVVLAVLCLGLGGCSSSASPGLDNLDAVGAPDAEIPFGKPCSKNGDCGDGFCDPIEGACVMCTVDAHCPDGLRCVSGACLEGILCQPGSASCDDLGNAIVCNAVGTAYQSTQTCDDGIDCTADSCIEGQGCVFKSDESLCDDGNECTLDACLPESGCHYEVAEECKTGGLADVTPSKLVFADTIPEEQVSKEDLTVHNAGLGTLKVLRMSVSPAPGAFYFQVADETLLQDHTFDPALEIGADDEAAFQVMFAPENLGEYEGTLTLHTNDPTKPEGKVTIPLVGSGVSDNCVGVSPATVAFGTVDVGVTAQKDLLLENCGDGLVPIYAISLLGNNQGAFSLAASLTPPFDLDVGQSTVITLGFSPPQLDTSYEAKLVIENGAPKTPLLEVPLSGESKP